QSLNVENASHTNNDQGRANNDSEELPTNKNVEQVAIDSLEFAESNEDPKTISDKDDLQVHDLVKIDGPMLCPEPELAPLSSKSESSDKWNDWNDDQWNEDWPSAETEKFELNLQSEQPAHSMQV